MTQGDVFGVYFKEMTHRKRPPVSPPVLTTPEAVV